MEMKSKGELLYQKLISESIQRMFLKYYKRAYCGIMLTTLKLTYGKPLSNQPHCIITGLENHIQEQTEGFFNIPCSIFRRVLVPNFLFSYLFYFQSALQSLIINAALVTFSFIITQGQACPMVFYLCRHFLIYLPIYCSMLPLSSFLPFLPPCPLPFSSLLYVLFFLLTT